MFTLLAVVSAAEPDIYTVKFFRLLQCPIQASNQNSETKYFFINFV